jgi:hypothetical protein
VLVGFVRTGLGSLVAIGVTCCLLYYIVVHSPALARWAYVAVRACFLGIGSGGAWAGLVASFDALGFAWELAGAGEVDFYQFS